MEILKYWIKSPMDSKGEAVVEYGGREEYIEQSDLSKATIYESL